MSTVDHTVHTNDLSATAASDVAPGAPHYAPRYEEVTKEMAGWLAAGQLQAREDIVEGLSTFPQALQRMFRGEHTGKLVLKVADG